MGIKAGRVILTGKPAQRDGKHCYTNYAFFCTLNISTYLLNSKDMDSLLFISRSMSSCGSKFSGCRCGLAFSTSRLLWLRLGGVICLHMDSHCGFGTLCSSAATR